MYQLIYLSASDWRYLIDSSPTSQTGIPHEQPPCIVRRSANHRGRLRRPGRFLADPAFPRARDLHAATQARGVLDPVHAPGTGTPETRGTTSRELLEILRELNLVGADAIEVSPSYDAEITRAAASASPTNSFPGMWVSPSRRLPPPWTRPPAADQPSGRDEAP